MKQKSETTTGKSELTGEKVTFRRPPTMREREWAAEDAMWRDIDKARSEYHVLMVPKNTVPPDARLAECYETSREWVVVGAETPRNGAARVPRTHSCGTAAEGESKYIKNL